MDRAHVAHGLRRRIKIHDHAFRHDGAADIAAAVVEIHVESGNHHSRNEHESRKTRDSEQLGCGHVSAHVAALFGCVILMG